MNKLNGIIPSYPYAKKKIFIKENCLLSKKSKDMHMSCQYFFLSLFVKKIEHIIN